MRTVHRILAFTLVMFLLASCGKEKRKSRRSSDSRENESLREELESSKKQQGEIAKELAILRKERERREAEARRKQALERAQLLAIQSEKLAHEKRAHLVQTYADKFGKQIVKAAGGGRDLVVTVKNHAFSRFSKKLTIDLIVSFNGSIIRANNYLMAGRMTLNEDGSGVKFARTYTNQNFKDMEARITMFKVLEAVAEENKKAKQRQRR